MLKLKKYNFRSLSPIDILFFSLLVNGTLLAYLNAALSRLPFISSLSTIVEPAVIIVITLVVLSIPSFLKVLTIGDYMFYIVCLCVFFLHYILFVNNQIYLDDLWGKFNLYVLPCYFIGRTIDYEKNANIITLLSILSLLAYSYLHFIYSSNVDKTEQIASGDMAAAFTVLPFIILIILDAFNTKRVISICLSIYGVFLLLSFGNRGSLLYTLIYVAILGFKKMRSMSLSQKWFILCIFGLLSSFVYVFYDIIFIYLYTILEQGGMSLRILDKVVEEEIGDSSGRDELTKIVFASLSDNPLGLGVGGDRAVLKGIYVHNLFVEILSIFGYWGGGFVILVFFNLIYKAYKKVINTNLYSFYVGLVCFGCLPLLTSSSFLEWPFFFMFLGYSVKVLSMKKMIAVR